MRQAAPQHTNTYAAAWGANPCGMTAAADASCRGPALRRIQRSAAAASALAEDRTNVPTAGCQASSMPSPLPGPVMCSSNKPGFRVVILGILMLLCIGGTQAFRVAAALRSLTKGPHPYLEAGPARILSHRFGDSSPSSSTRRCGFVSASLKSGETREQAPRVLPSAKAGRQQQEQQQEQQQGGKQHEQEPPRQQKARGEWAEGDTDGEEEEDEAEQRRRSSGRSKQAAGVIPTDEELELIVAQRGQELARMNGAASHLALAHSIWGQVLRPGSRAVDATCGNGHDALAIAKFLFPVGVSERLLGQLHCIDIQSAAIERTRRSLLEKAGAPLNPDPDAVSGTFARHVHFHEQNFRELPDAIPPESVSLLVYNLGYLPGQPDKRRTTMTADTLASLRHALFERPVLAVQGLVSIMCYRGHPEGAKEAAAVQDFVEGLDPEVYRCFVHAPLNRPLSPALITIYRLK